LGQRVGSIPLSGLSRLGRGLVVMSITESAGGAALFQELTGLTGWRHVPLPFLAGSPRETSFVVLSTRLPLDHVLEQWQNGPILNARETREAIT
jgi:hypothetical protein